MEAFRKVNPTTPFLLIIFFSLFHSPINGLVNITTVNPLSTAAISSATTKPISDTTVSIVVTAASVQKNASSLLGSKPEVIGDQDFIKNAGLFSFLSKKSVVGSSCSSNEDCGTKTNSSCVSGKCECNPGYVPSANSMRCLPKAKQLEDPCLEDAQCDAIYDIPGLAVCLSFQCVCSVNAKLINNNCYKKTVLGSTCKVDRDCSSIPYSYCFQEVCSCDPDFSPDETGTHCFPTNATGNVTNLDCSMSSMICSVLGRHAYCVNGTCACFPGYHLSSNKCIPEKRLGEECSRDSDCEADMKPKEPSGVRVCRNNKCTCKTGYTSVTEHNICKSGSSIIEHSLLLIIASLLFLLK